MDTSSIVHRPRQSPWPAIPMEQAWQIVDERIGAALGQLRTVEQRQSNAPELLGVVLAEPVYALTPVPTFRASIKDGYAVIAADGKGPRRVVNSSTASRRQQQGEGQAQQLLAAGECIRVTTGARVPAGADAVVQVEDTRVLEHNNVEELVVEIGSAPRAGQDIREMGSDVRLGEQLLDKGTVLGAPEIGLLALSGHKNALVYARPPVSVLSTGDELLDFFANEETTPQGVMDTNRPVLLSMFRSAGMEALDCGIAEDSMAPLVGAIRRALDQSDVLVVTGGVSMGEKDLLKEALASHFHFAVHFGRVLMKPGLPTTFASGVLNARPKFVFALPGNPVSALVTAHLFVLPQLRRVAGVDAHWESARIRVRLAHAISPLDARPEYRRAVLLRSRQPDDDVPRASCVQGSQMSSRLPSARYANLLLELPPRSEARSAVEEGELVTALVIGPL